MATSSRWAGNRYAPNSIHPAQADAFVQSSGTTATRPAPVDPAQQQPRVSGRQRHVHTSPLLPPEYVDVDSPRPRGGIPFWMWLLIIVLVGSVLFGIKVNYVDPWWTSVQNQIHYGDSKMGYSVLQLTGDSSLNNIISFIRTDSKTGSAYLIVIDVRPGKAPQQLIKPIMGAGATNQTVTGAVAEDVNGDGKTDVLITIQGSPVTFAILNDGHGTLSWATP